MRVPVVVGVKVMAMVQLLPAAIVVQLFVWPKSPVALTLLTTMMPAELLVSVTFCAALVVPTTVLPKLIVEAESVTGVTTREALAVLPVPPLVELTVALPISVPDSVGVTLAERVQLLPAFAVPPVSETIPEPATAVAVPPQLEVNPLGEATTMPVGRLEVKATPVNAIVLGDGLKMVSVKVLTPFKEIALGTKPIPTTGFATTVTLIVPATVL